MAGRQIEIKGAAAQTPFPYILQSSPPARFDAARRSGRVQLACSPRARASVTRRSRDLCRSHRHFGRPQHGELESSEHLPPAEQLRGVLRPREGGPAYGGVGWRSLGARRVSGVTLRKRTDQAEGGGETSPGPRAAPLMSPVSSVSSDKRGREGLRRWEMSDEGVGVRRDRWVSVNTATQITLNCTAAR
ncbi:hypothetical protein Z043_117195 [Scleropages formosus]|uniref:Uncharacterized protein n=1 Tax=Scleropages formosus TaxID=113540 RepID=A0A0P7TT69_SCLFO|nr:hypothetical protein Z043_117195 [Scleropages formosus]